ncbi:MAG: hypothetical protein K6B28_00155 [Lachnospiraceae bacterium]|nr:hypothetical protein [Lachnospiraceae bacterium]
MVRKNSIFRQIFQWILAGIIALFIMNIICFFYYSPFREIKREQGSNTGFLMPDERAVYALEGYSFAKSDKRGYVNRDLPLEDTYYLVAGASHTEGLFLPVKDRYSDVLNTMLGGDDTLKVYNIGRSGNFFSVVTQHFDGILGEFPDARAIIIETDTLAYDTKAWRDSMIQAGYDGTETLDSKIAAMSQRERLVMDIKKYLPLVRVLHKQYLTKMDNTVEDDGIRVTDAYYGEFDEDYRKALDELMAFLRSKTDKQLIIIYHPAVSIEKDGSMKLLTNGCEDIFAGACEQNDIDFIDMSPYFEEGYENRHIVPYGFYNTTMGAGHTNKEAHRMMAEAIYEVLEK